MNHMKKSTVTIIVIVIIIIVGIIVFGRSGGDSTPGPITDVGAPVGSTTPSTSVAVSETVKVSSKVSSYQNDELGFSVKYPNAWEKSETANGVTFIMPIDQSQVSTIAKLQADVSVTSGKCAFPPVTTIQDRGTLVVGSKTLNMISMTNTVQGRNYVDRMYSLQNNDVCYVFAFSSIAQSPTVKNLTGSNLTQAQNNNRAMVTTADVAFTDMVKTFMLVTGPQGKDESQVVPMKK